MAETVLVVGLRKLGREIALHFGRARCRVVCAARTPEDTQRVAAEVSAAGGEGVPFVCDITDAASLPTLAPYPFDLCIAAQAPGLRFGAKPLLDIDDAEVARGFDVTVRGTWNLLKAVGPGLVARGRGTFVQIGTSSGVRTRTGFAALGANQHALRALVQVAAKEWREAGGHGAYVPVDGGIASEKTRAWAAEKGGAMLIEPSEIARACEYLYRQSPTSWTHELVLRTARGEWTSPT